MERNIPEMSSTEGSDVEANHETAVDDDQRKGLRLTKTFFAFFLQGFLVTLPATVTATAASSMFDGMTGVFEVSNSAVAFVTTLATPFLLRRFSFQTSIVSCSIATALIYLICALPNPMSTAKSTNEAGPVIGSMLTGFMHAFGQSIITSLAAYFPREAVLALSAGMGLAVIVGPSTLIGLLAALDQEWRRALLVYIATAPLMVLVWFFLMEKSCRDAAEQSRIAASKAAAFRPSRLLFRMILPRLVPFMLSCVLANLSTMGLAPALQELGRFQDAPKGNLQYEQANCLLLVMVSGIGNFVFSTLAGIWPRTHTWRYTALGTLLCVVAVVQLVAPHLVPYYGVFMTVMFLIGADVGIGRTNCMYAISEDFKEHDDATRSFAMGFGGAANFMGDALGGGLAIMIEKLATRHMEPSQWPKVNTL